MNGHMDRHTTIKLKEGQMNREGYISMMAGWDDGRLSKPETLLKFFHFSKVDIEIGIEGMNLPKEIHNFTKVKEL